MSLQLSGTAKLLQRGSTSFALNGDFKQTELNWGDFSTRGDVGLNAHFDDGLLASDGAGQIDVDLRNASLQSGGGGGKGWAASVPALEVRASLARKAGKLAGSARLNAPAARQQPTRVASLDAVLLRYLHYGAPTSRHRSDYRSGSDTYARSHDGRPGRATER